METRTEQRIWRGTVHIETLMDGCGLPRQGQSGDWCVASRPRFVVTDRETGTIEAGGSGWSPGGDVQVFLYSRGGHATTQPVRWSADGCGRIAGFVARPDDGPVWLMAYDVTTGVRAALAVTTPATPRETAGELR